MRISVNTPVGLKVIENSNFCDSNYIGNFPDVEFINRSCGTHGVWEYGTDNFVIVVVDFPNNPECVVSIVVSEVGAETDDGVHVVDDRGYIGYIVDGYFVRNK